MGNQITIRVFSNLPMSPHILDSIHSQDVIKICKHNPEQGARLPTNGGTVLSRPDQSWSSSCPHSWILTEPLQSHWPRIPLVRLRTRRYVTILRNWALSPQLVSQSELSVGGDWPIRAEHQEPCRDQYTEPPTASVLGGVYLKSAPVRNWKDTDILIEIRTRALLFFSTSALTEIKFLCSQVSACRSHFLAPIRSSFSWNKNEFRPKTWTGQWHNVAWCPPCQRIMCDDTRLEGRTDNWSLLQNKGFPPPLSPPLVSTRASKQNWNKQIQFQIRSVLFRIIDPHQIPIIRNIDPTLRIGE